MTAIPQDFISRIQSQFPNKWEKLIKSLEADTLTSIRINPKKKADLYFELSEKNNWCERGFYLAERPLFTLDPFHHLGAYYVQEASSMFIDFVISYLEKNQKFKTFLDLCASPGGKSSILLDHINNSQFLVSNEMIPNRNLILRENLTKWGHPNFIITENKPADFSKLKNYFDFILIDAPCSGEGMFRKDPIAREEWSLKNVEKCSIRQLAILENAWEALADGGILVYSTCTFASDENELLIQKFKDSGKEFTCLELPIDKSWGIDIVHHKEVTGYQFLPSQLKGEGFFCSVLQKSGQRKTTEIKLSKSYINAWLVDFIDEKNLENYSTYKFKKSLFLAPNVLLDELIYLQSKLYVKQIGIEVGNYLGELIYPNQGLATVYFEKIYSQTLDLNLEQALDFLANITVDIPLENGLTLLTYKELSLGFISNEKGKIENLYPQNWKIRHRHQI